MPLPKIYTLSSMPLNKKHKRVAKIALITTLAFIGPLLIIFLFFYTTFLYGAKSPISGIKSDYYWFKILNGKWARYQDNNLHISFEYPINANWKISKPDWSTGNMVSLESSSSSCINIGEGFHGTKNIKICTNPDQQGLKDRLTNRDFSHKDLKLGNNEYTVLERASDYVFGRNLISKDKTFWIDLMYPYRDYNTGLANDLIEKIFVRIISSIKRP